MTPGTILAVPDKQYAFLILGTADPVAATIVQQEPYLQQNGILTQIHDETGRCWYQLPAAALLKPESIVGLEVLGIIPLNIIESIREEKMLLMQFLQMRKK